MTRFVLNSPMAADRGFTQRETKAGIAEAEKVCRVVYGWAGDPGFGPPARDIMVENVQRARECASPASPTEGIERRQGAEIPGAPH